MVLFSSGKFKCSRCDRKGEQLPFAPFPNEIGTRIYNEICQICWKEWMQRQNQLINHFGLDVADPEAQDFLFDQIKLFLFNEGSRPIAEIDTSKEGTIKW